MLSPNRDLIAAKLFLRLALSGARSRPRVINVDGHPAYASAVAELKQTGELGGWCRCRTAPYLNSMIEHDHRFIKKRITASVGFRSLESACRTIDGCEAMHAIRKGQVRWVAKGDPAVQRQFIHTTSLGSSHRAPHVTAAPLAPTCNRAGQVGRGAGRIGEEEWPANSSTQER